MSPITKIHHQIKNVFSFFMTSSYETLIKHIRKKPFNMMQKHLLHINKNIYVINNHYTNITFA